MNLILFVVGNPVLVLLLKCTALFGLGWIAQLLICRRHPRLRMILWRSVLCFSLVLPLTQFFPFTIFRIPIRGLALTSPVPAEELQATPPGPAMAPSSTSAQARSLPAHTLEPISAKSIQPSPVRHPIAWKTLLFTAWALGFAFGCFRLGRLQFQLSRLRRNAASPNPILQRLTAKLRSDLAIQRPVELRLSDHTRSPFICGPARPLILLPTAMAHELSPTEVTALLSHELAHLRHHDLVWCLGWQCMKVAFWFHPLVWSIPAAHNFACEEEADRIASGQVRDLSLYAQSLARLTLRVLSLPALETELSLNGASQIARRLSRLQEGHIGHWNWKHSLGGCVLAAMLGLIAVGSSFSQTDEKAVGSAPHNEFREVLVTVRDQDGKPIEGAEVLPDGFRVKGAHSADANHWGPHLLGGPAKAITDSQGRAHVKYPLLGIPEEREFTGALILSVFHPEFSTVRVQTYLLDGTEAPIQLKRGLVLEVSGYFGPEHQPVTELIPNLSQEGLRPEDWQKTAAGGFAFHKLSPGGHFLQLTGRLPSGAIVFSEGLAFTAEPGKQYRFALEMKPGIRLEGRIDDHVPKPVKNGRVIISVRPKEFPALLVPEELGDLMDQFGYFCFWKSYQPIGEDGSFVFESIPPGEVDVIVHGDGFVSSPGGEPANRINGKLVKGLVIGVPQAFPLTAPTTSIEVATEKTATLELTAKTASGKPVSGAMVDVNPNVMRLQTALFGTTPGLREMPFQTLPTLPDLYSAVTDQDGVAIIRNIPVCNRNVFIFHPQLEVPLREPGTHRRRDLRCLLSPGETQKLVVTLEPKGKDFTGPSK